MPELPAVDTLSDDDDEQDPDDRRPQKPAMRPGFMEPITELSEESSDHSCEWKELGKARKRKRAKRDGPTPGQRLVSEVHCKALLGRRCKGCKRHCMSAWLSKGKFQDVMRFRVQWAATHKLDQDKIVAKRHLVDTPKVRTRSIMPM